MKKKELGKLLILCGNERIGRWEVTVRFANGKEIGKLVTDGMWCREREMGSNCEICE